MSRLVLIDGSSYLFRAFHALPPLTAPDGSPSGALFGIVNMLRSTLKEQPEHVAFVVDAPGPTFRDAMYPEYKAQRPPMPDELRAQIEPMLAIVQALGIPLLRVPGVEADDVIGTLAVQAVQAGMDVTISSSDKDFAQLVRPGIRLLNTMTGSILDTAGVQAKFAVPPEQIVDLLALMGDSVDNIRGVDKCGAKTAAKWLAQYGDLDGVLAHAHEIGGKVGENLRAALPRLDLNRRLLTIKTDVELAQGPAELVLRMPDRDALRTLYQRYGFNTALRALDEEMAAVATVSGAPRAPGASAPAPARDSALAVPGQYETVLDADSLGRWIARLRAADEFAIDTETDGLDPMRAALVGISFSAAPGSAAYVPLAHTGPGAPAQLPMSTVLDALRPLLTDPSIGKIGQHGKYDLHILRRHGIDLAGYRDDTLLESFVLDATATRHDMDALARHYLGYQTTTYEQVAGKGARQIPFSQVDVPTATAYAAEDADVTLRLHRVLSARLAAEPTLVRVYREIEMPLLPVLARIEANGVCIDTDNLRQQSHDLSLRMRQLECEAHELAGRSFNLDSTKQLQTLLFDQLGLEAVLKTPTGQPSTNEEALEAIADRHPLPRLILEYRSLAKLRSTYTDKLPEMVHPETGRVHTRYHQAGAATGRLSSSDPNLQNIPIRTADGRRVRSAFVAPPGCRIVAFDYSQIELRIMAHLSADPGLLAAFEAGQDVHRATAAEVFAVPIGQVSAEQRRAAKAINFGLMYGMSAFGLARQLGITRADAQDYIALYFSRYPGVRAFMDGVREQARSRGYVETMFGRRLYLTHIHAHNQAQRAGAERTAINAPLQGTAADIIKRAMVTVDAWLAAQHRRALMIMQVHDELVFEADADFVPELIDAVRARMQAAAELKVPLLVEAGSGDNWDQAH